MNHRISKKRKPTHDQKRKAPVKFSKLRKEGIVNRNEESPKGFWDRLYEMDDSVSLFLIDKYQIKIHRRLPLCPYSLKYGLFRLLDEDLANYWRKVKKAFPIQCEKLAKIEKLDDGIYQDKRALRLQCRMARKQWDSSYWSTVLERSKDLVSFLRSRRQGTIFARISQGKVLEYKKSCYEFKNWESQEGFFLGIEFPHLDVESCQIHPGDNLEFPPYWGTPFVLRNLNHDFAAFAEHSQSMYKWNSLSHGIFDSPDDENLSSFCFYPDCTNCSIHVLPQNGQPSLVKAFFQGNGTLKGYASETWKCVHGNKRKLRKRWIVTILLDEMERNRELKDNYQPDWFPSCLWDLICDYYP